MKNSSKKLRKAAKTVAVTSLMTLPLFSPNDLYAQDGGRGVAGKQSSFTIAAKCKSCKDATIVGVDNGNAVFKNDRGEFFTVDGQTGDMQFISPIKFADFKLYGKTSIPGKQLVAIKYPPAKEGTNVTILGVDKDGQTIHQNSRGETFYVHPTTGDFIYLY
jgi:hypothetical protein